jgi:hypothetical protein
MYRNKRKLAAAIAVLTCFAAGLSETGYAANAPDSFGCSTHSLVGYYAFTLSGKRPDGQVVGVAMTRFDGHGFVSQTDNTNADSGVGPPNRVATGTYSVNADCTGTMTLTFDQGPTLDLAIVVDENDAEIRTAVMTPNVLVTSTGHRVLTWP